MFYTFLEFKVFTHFAYVRFSKLGWANVFFEVAV